MSDSALFSTVRPQEFSGTPMDVKIFFDAACLTDVNVLLSTTAELYNSIWAGEAVRDFRASDCTGFHSGAVAYRFGLHRMIESFAESALSLADGADSLSARQEGSKMMESLYFGTREFTQGILMSAMFYLEATHSAVATANLVVGAMFAIVVCSLLFQYFFLGTRVEKLLRENAFITMNMEALVEAARAAAYGDAETENEESA